MQLCRSDGWGAAAYDPETSMGGHPVVRRTAWVYGVSPGRIARAQNRGYRMSRTASCGRRRTGSQTYRQPSANELSERIPGGGRWRSSL